MRLYDKNFNVGFIRVKDPKDRSGNQTSLYEQTCENDHKGECKYRCFIASRDLVKDEILLINGFYSIYKEGSGACKLLEAIDTSLKVYTLSTSISHKYSNVNEILECYNFEKI